MKHLERLIKRKGRMFSKEEVDAFYSSRTWRKVRKSILERDDYLCQKCLEEDRPMPADTVHHIIHLRDDPMLALEPTNLISLCHECHEREHDRFVSREDTKEETSSKINVFTVEGNPNKL